MKMIKGVIVMAYPFRKMSDRKLKQFAEELKRENITFTDIEEVLIKNNLITDPLKSSTETVCSDHQPENLNRTS